MGDTSLSSNTTGIRNSAFGAGALRGNITGSYNTAIGVDAIKIKQSGQFQTDFSNTTGVGYDSRVSGSNQVQLGDSSTTTYAMVLFKTVLMLVIKPIFAIPYLASTSSIRFAL